jgi:hypothetical protein
MNTPRCGLNLSGALSKAVEERQAREDAEKADYAREVKVLAELRVLKLSRASEDLLLKRRIENLLSRATSNSSDASDEEKP